MTVGPDGEVWERHFGDRRTTSALRAAPGGLAERFGPASCRIALTVEGGALVGRVTGAALGPVPLPGALRGGSRKWEDDDGRYRFDVGAAVSRLGRLIRYAGWLERDGAP